MKTEIVKLSQIQTNSANPRHIKDNAGYGEWDYDMLANDWDAEDLDAWGLDVWQDEEAEEGADKKGPKDREPQICPHCGKIIEQ